jgi:glycosyltransferase involved in cell wall biosynthesis
MNEATPMYDVICLSHLRWDFVFQRPQHLLTRCARERRVFYVEEHVRTEGHSRLELCRSKEGVYVVVPHVANCRTNEECEAVQAELLRELPGMHGVSDYVLWYYTPMALPLARGLTPLASVYDCMDELSAFRGAPPELTLRERDLFSCVDLVFTGGQTLFEAKCRQHSNVHAFPSSVDVPHFARARVIQEDPPDQADIPHPRLGFFGVIDERMDLELLSGIAEARPRWQLVMLGPVVKICPEDLPRRPNIHYLEGKPYADLPRYIANWDVALLPFAKNASTKFISPTKTPEYLAAGKPVVSTSIRDVVRPYGREGLVRIADTVRDFVSACEAALAEPFAAKLKKADAFLARLSWDRTWAKMADLVDEAVARPGAGRGSSGAGGEQRWPAAAGAR